MQALSTERTRYQTLRGNQTEGSAAAGTHAIAVNLRRSPHFCCDRVGSKTGRIRPGQSSASCMPCRDRGERSCWEPHRPQPPGARRGRGQMRPWAAMCKQIFESSGPSTSGDAERERRECQLPLQYVRIGVDGWLEGSYLRCHSAPPRGPETACAKSRFSQARASEERAIANAKLLPARWGKRCKRQRRDRQVREREWRSRCGRR